MSGNTKLGSMPLLSNQCEMRHFGRAHFLEMWANVCFVEADDGVVVFDAGFEFYGPRIVQKLREITDMPVRYIVYGHGHGDHAFGAGALIADAEKRGQPRPIIVAHKNLVKRFDRYREMLTYHEHINRIQFAIPDNLPAFQRNYLYPDLTYEDSMSLKLGGLTFDLHHSHGETDDTTWMFVPELKTACVSDLWVWSCPNIGNPLKVQRYENEWAAALEQIAAREPEILLPGHGPAIEGKEEIKTALLTVARALRFLHDEVVRMLNEGKWQEEILNSFTWPEEFKNNKWLAPIYGHPYFVVQGILRRYHGWFDGNPSHVFASPSSEIAREVIGLSGGPSKLLDRARALAKEGKTQLALHIADFALDGSDGDRREALELKRDLLQTLAGAEPSLIARNILLGGVRVIKKTLDKK